MPTRSSKRVDTPRDEITPSRVAGSKRASVAVSPTVGSHAIQESPKKRTKVLPDSGSGVTYSRAATPQPVSGRRLSFGSSNDPAPATPAPADITSPIVEKSAKRIRKLTTKGAAYQAEIKSEPQATPNLLNLLDTAFNDGSFPPTPSNKGKPSTSVSTTHAPASTANKSPSATPTATTRKAKSIIQPIDLTPTPTASKRKGAVNRRAVIEICDESDDDIAPAPPSSDPPAGNGASDDGTLSDESSLSESDKGAGPVNAQHVADKAGESDEGLSDFELQAEIERLQALRRARKGKHVAAVRESTPRVHEELRSPRSPIDDPRRPETPLPDGADSRSGSPASNKSNNRQVSCALSPRILSHILPFPSSSNHSDAGEEMEPEPYCELKTITGYEPQSGRAFDLNIVADYLPETVMKKFLSAEHFTSYRPFANIARSDPSLFRLNNDKQNLLVWAKDGKPVVVLMPGGLTSSDLLDGFTFPSKDNKTPTTLKRVVIAPTEEHRNAFRVFLRKMFDRPALKMPVETDCDFSFATKKKFANAPSATKGKNSIFYGNDSKTSGGSHNPRWFEKPFPHVLEYDATVPVYDSRAHDDFLFDKAGFSSLPKMPPYLPARAKHPKELHPDSVVTVGYTINLWGPNDAGLANLSINLQFVILLGIMQA